jgi:hypothetical protein
MPECSEIGLMLGAAGDGELEQSALRKVTHHLNGCASCTGELSDYSTIGRELKAIAVLPSLEGFTKSVLDVIAKLVVVAMLAIAVHAVVFPTTEQIAKTVANRPAAPSSVARSARLVDVQVDSAFVASADDSGAFIHRYQRTKSGRMIVFQLPGGKTLHVQPRAIDGGMIAMEVVLFDGTRPTMTANLKLQSGDTFALTGQQSSEGTLLLRISPTRAASASTSPKSL